MRVHCCTDRWRSNEGRMKYHVLLLPIGIETLVVLFNDSLCSIRQLVLHFLTLLTILFPRHFLAVHSNGRPLKSEVT